MPLSPRPATLAALITAALATAAVSNAQAALPDIPWVRETPLLTPIANPFGSGTISVDGDDPAVWLHPTDAARSLVIATAKNGGLRVYDLAATERQSLLNSPSIIGGSSTASRLNNVDVQYNFLRADGSRSDVAVFTDRGQDRLRLFAITGTAGAPLQEIALAPNAAQRLFPDSKGAATLGNPIADQATGYGLALYRDATQDKLYALVTQRREAAVAQFELVDTAQGFVASKVNQWNFPTTYTGSNGVTQVLASGSPRQFEGMVVDQQTGILYAGQEDVGIWRINLKIGLAEARPVIESNTFDNNSPLSADIEGLTIRYGNNGDGVLVVSSQGDSSFAAYSRRDMHYLGGFKLGSTGVASGANSGVDHSDGADVTSFALPGFDKGLLISHDGANGLNPDGTPLETTNFKYVAWSAVASNAANPELQAFLDTPTGFDPRNVSPVPEPAAWALMAGGLALVLARRRLMPG